MTDQSLAMAPSGPIEKRHVPRAAAWLGGLGLIPFVAGALMVITVEASWAYDPLRYYAAAILSFMGGVQWGLAMTDARAEGESRLLWLRLSMSVVPSLIAWLALLLPAPLDLVVIAAAFGLLLLSDLFAVRQGWAPAWYPRLRIPLTGIVLAALLLPALGAMG
jgi:hypothetical protein